MKTSDATLLLPAPAWTDPRVHLLDDTWLLTIFAILLATALPWLGSSFEVDFAAAALGLLALAALHVAFTALINPARASGAWRSRALIVLHALGMIIVGFIWHHAGGLQNPAFLMVFVLPVVGAIFLSRWQPYLMAAVAVLVVGWVALSQAPELRWYLTGLNAAGGWLAAVFGTQAATLNMPFSGFYAPSNYFVVLLEVFAILLFACAVAAEYLGTVFDRLHAHVFAARAEAERGQELWATLIENLPLPALLVDTDTLQVICASEQVALRLSAEGSPPAGQNIFEAIHFSYPDVIQGLIGGAGGVARLSAVRVAGELRMCQVRVQHVAQRGRRFALVIIEDITEAFCAQAALDAADYAAFVVDSNGRVLAFNRPAHGLFPGTEIGARISSLLSPDAAAHWWEPTLTARRKMHLEILQRVYQVTSSPLSLPGEEERIHVVALRPVAKAALSDTTMTVSTLAQSS